MPPKNTAEQNLNTTIVTLKNETLEPVGHGVSKIGKNHEKEGAGNQDNFFINKNSFGVFDGVGGEAGGEEASSIAAQQSKLFCEELTKLYLEENVTKKNLKALEGLIEQALNPEIAKLESGGKTTASIGMLFESGEGKKYMAYASIGDSPISIYSRKTGKLNVINRMNNLHMETLIENNGGSNPQTKNMQILSLQEAQMRATDPGDGRQYPREVDIRTAEGTRRVKITSQAIEDLVAVPYELTSGVSLALGVDIEYAKEQHKGIKYDTGLIELDKDDIILACSDGLLSLTSTELEKLLAEYKNNPEQMTEKIVRETFEKDIEANARNNGDDKTLVIVDPNLTEL